VMNFSLELFVGTHLFKAIVLSVSDLVTCMLAVTR
jgi:hypothetical protein